MQSSQLTSARVDLGAALTTKLHSLPPEAIAAIPKILAPEPGKSFLVFPRIEALSSLNRVSGPDKGMNGGPKWLRLPWSRQSRPFLLGTHGNGELLDSWGLHRCFARWPALGLVFGVFACLSLYPGIIHSPATEPRGLALGLTVSFLVRAGLILVNRDVADYSGGWWR
jgi:hypothetical protein